MRTRPLLFLAVVDGDTVVVLLGGKDTTIRLIGEDGLRRGDGDEV